MFELATIPNHSPTCSGCPACNPFAAKLLGMSQKAYSDFLSGSTLANLAGNRKPALRDGGERGANRSCDAWNRLCVSKAHLTTRRTGGHRVKGAGGWLSVLEQLKRVDAQGTQAQDITRGDDRSSNSPSIHKRSVGRSQILDQKAWTLAQDSNMPCGEP